MDTGTDESLKSSTLASLAALSLAVSPLDAAAAPGMLNPPATQQVDKGYANRLADSIYWAEGGAKTSHPYGILAHYKNTSPRQACLNTINTQHKRWVKAGRPGEFIDFMASAYAPVGASNDPTGLNKNWPKNVKRIMAAYQKGKKAP